MAITTSNSINVNPRLRVVFIEAIAHLLEEVEAVSQIDTWSRINCRNITQEDVSKLDEASCQFAQITHNQAEAGSFGHVSDGFETWSWEPVVLPKDQSATNTLPGISQVPSAAPPDESDRVCKHKSIRMMSCATAARRL
jgi:hypothetical protein